MHGANTQYLLTLEAAAELAKIVKETGFGGTGLPISFWETEPGVRWWEKYGGSSGFAGHAAYVYEQRLVDRAMLDAEGLVPPRYYPPDMWAALENRVREAEQRLLEDSDFRDAVRTTLEEGGSWDQRMGETRKMEQCACSRWGLYVKVDGESPTPSHFRAGHARAPGRTATHYRDQRRELALWD